MAEFPAGGTVSRPVALPRGRRSAELAMLSFAVVIMAFAYVAAGLGLNGHVPSGLVTYVAGFAVLMVLAHLAVRKFAPWADPLLLPLAAVLNGLGIVMIYRLQESGRNGNPGLPITTLTSHAAAVPADVDGGRHRRVHRRADRDPRAEGPAAVYLHPGHDRPDPAGDPRPAADQPQLSQRSQGLDHPRRLLDPAGRVRQDRASRVLRRLPGRQAGRALAGRPAVHRDRPAASQRPRPDPGALGAQPADPDLRVRYRHIGPVLRPVHRHALHRDPAQVVADDRPAAVRGRRAAGGHGDPARARAVHDLDAPVRPAHHLLDVRATGPGARGDGVRRHLRHRPRPRRAIPHARSCRATSSSPASARNSG